MSDEKNNWMAWFRLATPFMTLVLMFYANGVRTDLKEMRLELFHHLTNAEMHVPRSTVISKDEFTLYQSMRDKQMADLKDGLCRIEALIEKRMERK